MEVSEVRNRIKGQIWHGIAQSGVDISHLSEEEGNQLVGTVTESVLVEMNDIFNEIKGEASTAKKSKSKSKSESKNEEAENPSHTSKEKLVWEGGPFLNMSVHYQITNQRLIVSEGILSKDHYEIELVRIIHLEYSQNVAERILNIGDVYVESKDPSIPEITLKNVIDPTQVHRLLRQAVLSVREKYGMSYKEEM